MTLLLNRIIQSFITIPTWQDWAITGAVFVAFTAIALLLGVRYQLLTPTWRDHSPHQIWQTALMTLFAPALLEELGYRVLIIPHPSEGASASAQTLWLIISLAVFIVAHPLNAITLYKRAYPLFLSPVFLIMASLLGLGLTGLYQLSGSIYPIVLMHWIVVFVWLVGLGGNLKLGYYSR
ncbi:CPBP family glutamic-type intramembrane protease [Leptolyngbya sp. AN02str]|uniref:CPBP family glutamic-type intramembrane protease n=1 Tax=Leptolyngbya sp. AN02str TaxID=3423363 RepID=UPI003D31B13D